MARNLVLVSHTFWDKSKANKAAAEALAKLPDTEVIHLESKYPHGVTPEGVKELREKMLACTHLVFLFPMFWAASPAGLKNYMDMVWGTDFAYAEGLPKGAGKLEGKTLHIFSTAGASREELDVDQCYANIRFSAEWCRMNMAPIVMLYNACGISGPEDERVKDFIERCKANLSA